MGSLSNLSSSKRTQKCVGFFLFILLVSIVFLEFTPALSTSPGEGWTASTWFHLYTPPGNAPMAPGPTGLTPTQIKNAYNLPTTGGNGTMLSLMHSIVQVY
jgi:hypothetical protein